MSITSITPYASITTSGWVKSQSGAAQNIPAGALIVSVCHVVHGSTGVAVSDTAGNTYTVLQWVSANSGMDAYLAYCTNAIANTANTVTWTCPSANISGVEGSAYATSSGTWAVDGTPQGFAEPYGTAFSSTITTTGAGVIAIGVDDYYGTSATFAFTGVTQQAYVDGSSSYSPGAYADTITTAAQTSLPISVTESTSGRLNGYAAAFTVTSSGVSASATQTNGTDLQSASATLGVGSHAAQTNGTDLQAASGTPLIVANAAQANSTDAQSASVALGVGSSAAQINGTDVQLASTNFNYNTLNSAYLYAAQQAGTPLFYTLSPPAQASTAVYTASGTFTVPSYANYFLVSATAAGGSPYGSAGRQTSRQSLPVVAGDALTVSISPNVTVKRGTQTLLSLLDGAAYAKGTQGGLPQASGIVGLGSGVDQGVPLPAALVFIWN